MYSYATIAANRSGAVRREERHGRAYLVAPVVMLRPGVVPGSRGPLLYPHEEIRRNPADWSGVPLVLGHPHHNGTPLSARTPDVPALGRVYNVHANGVLAAEAWFDIDATRFHAPALLADLEAGRPVEVSTGLYLDEVPESGTHNGRAYKGVARAYKPDHLAVLFGNGERGACSIADGCGLNVVNCGCNPFGEDFATVARNLRALVEHMGLEPATATDDSDNVFIDRDAAMAANIDAAASQSIPKGHVATAPWYLRHGGLVYNLAPREGDDSDNVLPDQTTPW